MAESQGPGSSATETSTRDELAGPVVSDQPRFTVGPPDPVTDPQQLPAVTAEEEAEFVTWANRGAEHPDNAATDADDEGEAELTPEPSAEDDDDLPGEDELGELVSDVDVDDVDSVGFDDADLAEPFEIDITDSAAEQPVRGGF
jgi:hypothetical protein